MLGLFYLLVCPILSVLEALLRGEDPRRARREYHG